MKDSMHSDDDGMDDLYQGGTEPGEGEGESIDEENRESMAKSAVVPLAVLTGKKGGPPEVGDEVVVKVKAINGEDATVEYSETPPGEIGEGEGYDEHSKESADKELDEMSESGGY